MTDAAGRRWPWGIAAVLLLTVVGNAAVYWAANDDNAAAVEPDYYRKAVEWDSTLARGDRSRALGWTSDVALGPDTLAGQRAVQVRLRDSGGAPVPSALIEITAIHNSLATRPVQGLGVTDRAGMVRLLVPLAHHGVWELRLVATRGAERYLSTVHRDTEAPSTVP